MTTFARSLITLVVLASALAAPDMMLAQRDAGTKARGDYSGTFWSTRSATGYRE